MDIRLELEGSEGREVIVEGPFAGFRATIVRVTPMSIIVRDHATGKLQPISRVWFGRDVRISTIN